ncbi:RLA class II histocompatibility antigen, DP alpha-1 chain [Chanos chanos]|uniref:RLA class II histocompatibility antigen, DP alpha-1 chain n=1 Tax=Chanos chanos TaxID=29144 RepID=A0A6J2V880_CHACN|nr:RLA class II histocompatibility antigen, DP alpha-1 chain-like [Chanos chanos]
MRLCVFVLAILTAVVFTGAQVTHVDMNIYGCSDTRPGEDFYGLDGEEMGHADFALKQFVMTLPEFADPFSYGQGAFSSAVAKQHACLENVRFEMQVINDSEEVLTPPESSIYTRKLVKPGVNNTLICHVTGFFPPMLRLRWAKNYVYQIKGIIMSRSRLNKDGTFNMFSALSFTPEQGDVYSCTVEHQALAQPLIKEWMYSKGGDPENALHSIIPSVVCGVGSAVGLLAIAIGIFLIIKGSKCN